MVQYCVARQSHVPSVSPVSSGWEQNIYEHINKLRSMWLFLSPSSIPVGEIGPQIPATIYCANRTSETQCSDESRQILYLYDFYWLSLWLLIMGLNTWNTFPGSEYWTEIEQCCWMNVNWERTYEYTICSINNIHQQKGGWTSREVAKGTQN